MLSLVPNSTPPEPGGMRVGRLPPENMSSTAVHEHSHQGSRLVAVCCKMLVGHAIVVRTCVHVVPGWRPRHPESLCFSPSGELLLYGPSLWDPRSPRCVHTFDLLSYNPCASTFHQAGLEVVVNAEVSLGATF